MFESMKNIFFPHLHYFFKLYSFFPEGEAGMFFLLFDTDLCYLVSRPPQRVVAGLRSSVTVNYGTLETDDQQELWNRERMHGRD